MSPLEGQAAFEHVIGEEAFPALRGFSSQETGSSLIRITRKVEVPNSVLQRPAYGIANGCTTDD